MTSSTNAEPERNTKNVLGFDCEIYDENGDKFSYIHLGYTESRAHQMLIETQTTEITLQSLKLLPVKQAAEPGAYQWLEKQQAKEMKKAAQELVKKSKTSEVKALVIANYKDHFTKADTDATTGNEQSDKADDDDSSSAGDAPSLISINSSSSDGSDDGDSKSKNNIKHLKKDNKTMKKSLAMITQNLMMLSEQMKKLNRSKPAPKKQVRFSEGTQKKKTASTAKTKDFMSCYTAADGSETEYIDSLATAMNGVSNIEAVLWVEDYQR
jgi:hypothetical protein